MPKTNPFRNDEASNPVVLQIAQFDFDSLPAVPVMPETLLCLDLVAQEPIVDLREMSQLVLDDLGATLQILRMASREYGNSPNMPHRIEDCISDLGVMACRLAVFEQTSARHSRHLNIARTWAHAREIAQCSKNVAEELPGVNPEQAYMVGLLHSIDSLPAVLGWDDAWRREVIDPCFGWHLAKHWALPHPVLEFFSEMINPDLRPAGWTSCEPLISKPRGQM